MLMPNRLAWILDLVRLSAIGRFRLLGGIFLLLRMLCDGVLPETVALLHGLSAGFWLTFGRVILGCSSFNRILLQCVFVVGGLVLQLRLLGRILLHAVLVEFDIHGLLAGPLL